MFNPIPESIAGLQCYRIHAKEKNRPTCVLFHGYGASGLDLYSLGTILNEEGGLDFHWVFPQGPVEIPFSPGYSGWAWFPIDMEALQRAMATGSFRNFAETDPKGMDEVRSKIDSLFELLNLKPETTILGGFSQGAMVSLDKVLRSPNQYLALLELSGTLYHEKRIREESKKLSGYTFFQSHGKSDPVLSFSAAKRLYEILKSSGWAGEFVEFDGGHEIPQVVLQKMYEFLKKFHG